MRKFRKQILFSESPLKGNLCIATRKNIQVNYKSKINDYLSPLHPKYVTYLNEWYQ